MLMTETFKLPEHFEIDPEIREQMSDRPGHQRCIEGAGELFLVLHEVPEAGKPEREAVFFWKRRDGLWVQQKGAGIGGLGRLMDRYEQELDEMSAQIDQGDRAEAFFRVLRRSSPVARSASNLVLALKQVLAMDPDDKVIHASLDRAREIARVSELQHADARAALNYWQARQAEEQVESVAMLNRRVQRLNLVVWLLLPLVALAALPGMNAAVSGLLKTLLWGALIAGLLAALAMLAAAFLRKQDSSRSTRWKGL